MKQEGIPDPTNRLRTCHAYPSPEIMQRFPADAVLVTGAAMFKKEPELYASIRRDIVPACGPIRSSVSGMPAAGAGRKPYSMAILLAEEGLYDRCRIYATDMDESSLRKARDGIFPAG